MLPARRYETNQINFELNDNYEPTLEELCWNIVDEAEQLLPITYEFGSISESDCIRLKNFVKTVYSDLKYKLENEAKEL